MPVEVWDRTPLAEQERIIGRTMDAGAACGAAGQSDPAHLAATDQSGELRIATNAHIRLASAQALGGVKMLRRATTSWTAATAGPPERGAALRGVHAPQAQSVPMQRARADHRVGGLRVPGRGGRGGYWCRSLFES